MSNIQKKKQTKLKLAVALSGLALTGGAIGYALHRRNKLKKIEKILEEKGLKLDSLKPVGQGFMNGLYYSGYSSSENKWYLLRYDQDPTINKGIYERTSILYKIFNYTNIEKMKSCSNNLLLPVNKINYDNQAFIVYEPGYEQIKFSFFGKVANSSIYGKNYPPSDKDIQLMYSLCSSVYCLHFWGVAHRGINPTSIFITVLNKIFLAPSLETCNSTFLGYCHNPKLHLQSDMVLFTPPEILLKIKNNSFTTTFNEAKKMDIWSLGVTLYLYFFRKFPYFDKLNYFDWENMYSDNEEFRLKSSERISAYLNNLKTFDKETRIFKGIYGLKKYPEFHDFLQGLLELNPKKRFTIAEVIKRISKPEFAVSFRETLKILERNKLFN